MRLLSANTIRQIQPVISKIDGMVDELDPTSSSSYLHSCRRLMRLQNTNTSLET